MTTFFEQLIQNETITSARNRVLGYLQAAQLSVTNWVEGAIVEQITQVYASASQAYANSAAAIIRGFVSLDTATDPGDVDPYDETNVDQEPGPGFLSHYGQNTFGTARGDSTFAVGFVQFVNGGAVARDFAPGGLVFTWTENSPPSPAPTYTNAADDSIYTNPDGTVTVPASSTLTIPVVADVAGSGSNCDPNSISLTTVLAGCSATNDTGPIVGNDREAAETYRERCRLAPNRVSLAGPGGFYKYFAVRNADGTLLQNDSGAEVNITRVKVVSDTVTGDVKVYYATDGGSAIAADVTAANDSIIQAGVPDAVTFVGAAANEVTIEPSGTFKYLSSVYVDPEDAKQAIVDALIAAAKSWEIGGFDQDVGGAGRIYTEDLEAIAASPPGIYKLDLSVFDDAIQTALGADDVAVISTTTADWTVES